MFIIIQNIDTDMFFISKYFPKRKEAEIYLNHIKNICFPVNQKFIFTFYKNSEFNKIFNSLYKKEFNISYEKWIDINENSGEFVKLSKKLRNFYFEFLCDFKNKNDYQNNKHDEFVKLITDDIFNSLSETKFLKFL